MVKEEVTREIRKYCELNENENATNKNIQNADDAMTRGNFSAIRALLDNKMKKFETNEIKARENAKRKQ